MDYTNNSMHYVYACIYEQMKQIKERKLEKQ